MATGLNERDAEARAKRYRDKAEECRQIAELAKSDEVRAIYTRLAASYEVMARQVDLLKDDCRSAGLNEDTG